MATIYEVSKKAGVCPATVSRVMSGNAKVRDKTKAKVLKAMDELGYKPNTIAQSLASKRTNSVGLLVTDFYGTFFGKMMSAVEAELVDAGKHAIIAAGHSDEEKERQAIEFLINRRCDALILHVEALPDDYLVELSKQDVPIVIINHKINSMKERCFYLDNEAGGYLATRKVIEAGHSKIAYIAGPRRKEDAVLRQKGHNKALEEAGISIDSSLVFEGDYRETGGEQGLLHFLDNNKDFTAIICANDEMAFGAMRQARELNIQLPEELSIIGFDDVVYSRYLFPALTTVDNPVTTMGQMAARWVLQNVYNIETDDIQNQFVPTVIERDSLVHNR